jgi:hypothetical protein
MSSENKGAAGFVGLAAIISCSILLSKHVPEWNNAKKNNKKNDKLVFEYDKRIVDVKYPKELPSNDSEQSEYENFVPCHCGESCTSELGICTRLYTTDNDGNKYLIRESLDSDEYCTFREYDCEGSLEDRTLAILNNMIDIQKYINSMNNNQTIKVFYKYTNNEKVYFLNKFYLDESYHHNIIIASSVFLTIGIMIFQCATVDHEEPRATATVVFV